MKALEMTSLYHKKTSHQRKKTSFCRKETSFQDITPIAQPPFTLYKQSLHPYLPHLSPIAYGANPVLPSHYPSIGKWLRRYKQTNAFSCFRSCETWSFGSPPELPISTSPRNESNLTSFKRTFAECDSSTTCGSRVAHLNRHAARSSEIQSTNQHSSPQI